MPNRQSGFTLVEIAIVLVIIGLLLGGVLKGQELINSAKVKNFAQDFRSVPLFIYGYQDKFRALPGDDKDPAGHVKGTPASTGTKGNGLIEGEWDSETVADETVLFWQHVRLAGLATGSTDFTDALKAGLPTNADGGRLGIQGGAAPIKNMSGTYFACSKGIYGKFVKQLDATMDDGDPSKGSMQAVESGKTNSATPTAGTTLASIDDSKTYDVCLGF